MPTFGLTGAVDTTQHAVLASEYGADYGVVGPDDWRVTAVAGADRSVLVAAGSGYGRGAIDVDTAAVTLAGGLVGSGTRWDTVVRRRTWGGAGASEFVILPGTSARAISAQRVVNPGVQDDQPVALVQLTAGQQMPTAIVDLRCWPGNGGLVAASVESLAYLDRLGSRVTIQDTDATFLRVLDTQGNPVWAPGGGARFWTANTEGKTFGVNGGELGLGPAMVIPASAAPRRVTVDFGATATTLARGVLEVVLRSSRGEVRIARSPAVNATAAGSYTETIPAGSGESFQLIAKTTGAAVVTSDKRLTYMTASTDLLG